jgi:hypothetical protein
MDHKLSIRENVLSDGSKTYDVWLTGPGNGTVVLHAADLSAAQCLAAVLAALIDEYTVDRVIQEGVAVLAYEAAERMTRSAGTLAKAAGYTIREGSYHGTTDDRLGRWYFSHKDDNGFRPWGAGHPTRKAAWLAAWEHAQQRSESCG